MPDAVTAIPESPASRSSADSKLNLNVVFTSTPGTAAALSAARTLAARLDAAITVLVPEVVPFPMAVDHPQISPQFLEARVRALTAELPNDVRVRILLCRNGEEAVLRALQPRSLVVIGGPKHWWPTRESALARRLEDRRHQVVFVPSK
jgi:hypothetical protein